jgi:tellurite resistance protein TehA-like permease
MRIAAMWMGGLALWIGSLSLLLWLWTSDDLPPALLTGAAVALALIGLFVATRSDEVAETRYLADSSLPTVVIVIGLAMMLNGLAFGLFLILIGAEVIALGVAGLVIQFVAERRARG